LHDLVIVVVLISVDIFLAIGRPLIVLCTFRIARTRGSSLLFLRNFCLHYADLLIDLSRACLKVRVDDLELND